MKKVMIGILILIPIVILLLVAAVSGIVSASAHIGVESISIGFKEGQSGTLEYVETAGKQLNFSNWLDVTILPERATNKTIEWSISNLQYLDAEYKASYDYFVANGEADDGIAAKHPAITLVDKGGNEVTSNTTGEFMVYGYCSFTVIASSEQHSSSAEFSVKGYDVERVNISFVDNNENSLVVGQSSRAVASYAPVDSVVSDVIWQSSNEAVATVDKNGVVSAVGEGSADISVKVNVYSSPTTYVQSVPMRVTVVRGASLTLGNEAHTHLSQMTLDELGIEDCVSLSGATLVGDVLTMTGEIATIVTSNGTFTLSKCDEDAIQIENAKHYSQESGYVFEVGDVKLKLRAKWLSSLKSGTPSGVVWTSSDEEIALVDNGVVSAVSNGVVTIKAICGTQEASITLSVQKKIASMQLSTSTAYYETVIGGLAREHVFASEKYVDITQNTSKEANSTLIVVKGEPQDATVDELAQFYDAYKFEIVSGGAYAQFDDTIANKLVFNSSALERRGKQEIKIKVSAKYPKYEAISAYTTEIVVVKAIYGVQVESSAEFMKAAEEQKTYAFAADNVITSNSLETTTYFYRNNPTEGVLYSEDTNVSSKGRYAIVLGKDIHYTSAPYTAQIFGDVYGNNHKISADKGLLEGSNEFFRVSWSDVTISNILLRVNDLGDDVTITNDEQTATLKGRGMRIAAVHTNCDISRLLNVTIEYSIIENSRQALQLQNVDVTLRGVIMRNTSDVGIYAPNRHNDISGKVYQVRNNITIENCIVSNTVATALSTSYERMLFRVVNKKCENLFITTKEQAEQMFGPDTRTAEEIEAMVNMSYVDYANDLYFKKTFVDRGLSGSVTQKGIFDIYNWVPMSKTNLIDAGSEEVNGLIKGVLYSVLSENPAVAPFRYTHNNEFWVHLGFMVPGISTLGDTTKLDETNFVKFDIEDERIGVLDVKNLEKSLIANILKILSIKIVGYKADQSGVSDSAKYKTIVPGSSYEINDKLVARLHGIY